MHLLVLSALVLSIGADSAVQGKPPRIETAFGPIEGFRYSGRNVNADVFLGIRYAHAPDHIYRFEKPLMVEKWGPIVHHATHFRASCIPHHRQGLVRENYSEDCLFLNIVTPTGRNPDELLPVLVYIHGGGFEIGDAQTYGYKTPAETFVSQGIIFVSIQYRLGPLGFFTTGDNVLPGNMGLWDQTMALQFLHKVLPAFGGDPDRITLSGHSAGSSSVSALLYSPHSDLYFDQAIEMSGSVFAEYSMSESVVAESKLLAETVGCKMKESEKIRECMKEVTMEDILDGVAKMEGGRRHSNFVKFQPHFDNEFFAFELEDMVRKAPKKKTLQGVTDLESALFVLMQDIEYLTGGVAIPESRWNNFTEEDFMDFLTAGVVTEVEFGRKMGPLLHLIKDFYLNQNAPDVKDSKFYIEQYTHLLSDLMFNVPVHHEIELKRSFGWDPYYYVIDYVSEGTKNSKDPLHGAYHASELRFLFDFMDLEKLPLNKDDEKFKKYLRDSFVAFIKTGNPSTSDLKWESVSNEKPAAHMRLNASPKMTYEHFRSAAMDFWLKTVPKTIGTDMLRKGRLPGATAHSRHTEL